MEEFVPVWKKSTWGKCVNCGIDPIPHWSAWLNNSMDVFLVRYGFSDTSGIFKAVRGVFEPILGFLAMVLFKIGLVLGFLSYGDDIRRAITYRSQVIWEYANEHDIWMRQIFFFGKPTELYIAKIFGNDRVFHSLPVPPKLQREVYWADDKVLLKERFRKEGIPVPESISVTTEGEAKAALAKLKAPVCVKPENSSRARHTTPYVMDDTQIEEAFRVAQQLCRWVAVEEHLEGDVCRATCVGGELKGFLAGHGAEITGDGVSTVQQLVEEKNAKRPPKVSVIEMTAVHIATLARRGYTLESVVEKGKVIPLIHWRGGFFGGISRELGSDIHSELRRVIEQAAKVTTLPIVGFDLIIPDAKKDPREQKWGFIEANSLPYIDVHYTGYDGNISPVADAVWELWRQNNTKQYT